MNRRAFMTWLVAGGGACLLAVVVARKALSPTSSPADLESLAALFEDLAGVRSIGERAFAALGEPDDLVGSLLAHERWSGADPRPAGDLFVEQMDEDLAAGRVLLVDGWLLSESEARLYALVYTLPAFG